MPLKSDPPAILKSSRWLKRFARVSAWLLLVTVGLLVISGWGITHTEIIYKATFKLVDRGLSNSIHRATNIPLVIFFLSHVLINIRLMITAKSSRTRLIDTLLIIIGLALLGIFLFVEYLA